MSRQEYQRKYYQENSEKIKNYSKDRYNKVIIKDRPARREYMRKHYEENREKYLVYSAKSRAKKHGIPFDLTIEDVKIPTVCPILGIPIFWGSKITDNSPSLDRIIPDLGYIKGNVCVISYKANRYKSNMTRDMFQKFLDYIDGKL